MFCLDIMCVCVFMYIYECVCLYVCILCMAAYAFQFYRATLRVCNYIFFPDFNKCQQRRVGIVEGTVGSRMVGKGAWQNEYGHPAALFMISLRALHNFQ